MSKEMNWSTVPEGNLLDEISRPFINAAVGWNMRGEVFQNPFPSHSETSRRAAMSQT
jgi:hypothetical protein